MENLEDRNNPVRGETEKSSITTPTDASKLWADIKHFKINEFDSPDAAGTGSKMNIEFVKILDKIRAECGFELKINSGFRTPEHNKEVGKIDASAHEFGVAADIYVEGSQYRQKLIDSARKNGICRIGVGKNFIHLDMDYTKPQGVTWLY